MTSEEKQKLKQKISREIEDARDIVVNLEEATRPIAPDNAIGRLSRMDALNSKSVNEAALMATIAKLSNLENSLARIDRPDFGHCSRCKQSIPFARLMFMPETDRCVDCSKR